MTITQKIQAGVQKLPTAIFELDAIVSWNFRHIVRLDKKLRIVTHLRDNCLLRNIPRWLEFAFLITAYELTGKPLSAYKRRQRRRRKL